MVPLTQSREADKDNGSYVDDWRIFLYAVVLLS